MFSRSASAAAAAAPVVQGMRKPIVPAGGCTGAVAIGAVWATRLYGDAWLNDHKLLVTFATWVLYAAALLLRRLRRWQGRQTALASLAGLCAILFSLVAVNFFFTDFHQFL